MEPKFQTSFIPKKPVTLGQPVPTDVVREVNIVAFVGKICLFFAVLATIGVYSYDYYLQNDIKKSETELITNEKAYGITQTKEIIQYSDKIKAFQNIVKSHTQPSNIFTFFEQKILPAVQIKKMTYDYSLKDTVAISLSLEAFDYISVAQQLDVFKADQRISKVEFSDLSLSESGTVTFAAKITLVSDLVHWKTSALTTNTATSTVR